jgi:N-acetylneuraminate synthase
MGVFIIAEAGVNHNGDIGLAKQLIDVAKQAGCDAVKFQTFRAEKIVTKIAQKAVYQVKNTGRNESQYEMLKKLELSYKEYEVLAQYSKEKNIQFLSTPFDEESADVLEVLGMKIFKIPSGEITNQPLLKHIAQKGKPMIVSTGMCTLDEIQEAVEWIYETGNQNVTLLHCTTNYPASVEEVNLYAMETMQQTFKRPVGYSDHTLGIEVPIAATALGATVIEKHFTLSREMEGPDHAASLEPKELEAMVKGIRNIENALGNGKKEPTLTEQMNRQVARKSIVAKQEILPGEKIQKSHLEMKRPGTGISPKYLDKVIGKVAGVYIPANTLLSWEQIAEKEK